MACQEKTNFINTLNFYMINLFLMLILSFISFNFLYIAKKSKSNIFLKTCFVLSVLEHVNFLRSL